MCRLFTAHWSTKVHIGQPEKSKYAHTPLPWRWVSLRTPSLLDEHDWRTATVQTLEGPHYHAVDDVVTTASWMHAQAHSITVAGVTSRTRTANSCSTDRSSRTCSCFSVISWYDNLQVLDPKEPPAVCQAYRSLSCSTARTASRPRRWVCRQPVPAKVWLIQVPLRVAV